VTNFLIFFDENKKGFITPAPAQIHPDHVEKIDTITSDAAAASSDHAYSTLATNDATLTTSTRDVSAKSSSSKASKRKSTTIPTTSKSPKKVATSSQRPSSENVSFQVKSKSSSVFKQQLKKILHYCRQLMKKYKVKLLYRKIDLKYPQDPHSCFRLFFVSTIDIREDCSLA
jgi:hypothetical protein